MKTLLEEKQFIFIIGAQRSGTSWLQTMLSDHPQVASTKVDKKVAELTIFNHYIAPLIRSWEIESAPMKQGRWNRGLPCLWSEQEFYSFLRYFLEQAYCRVRQNNDTTHILDKDPFYSQHVCLIDKLIPHSKFIHLIRDGRNVAVSLLSAKERTGIGTSVIGNASREWREHISMSRKAKDLGEDRYLEVRYEDLLSSTENVLNAIFDFCRLDTTKSTVKTIAQDNHFQQKRIGSPNPNISGPERMKNTIFQSRLSPYQRFVVERVAGELLRELEYADGPSWWYENKREKIMCLLYHYLFQAARRLKGAIQVLLSGQL